MMSNGELANRKVRFTEPVVIKGGELKSEKNKNVVHGTKNYVNGTLVTQEIEPKPVEKVANQNQLTVGLVIRPRSNSESSKNGIDSGISKLNLENEETGPITKNSIMKKPTTIPRTTQKPRPKREPMEVRKLVTFHDELEVVDSEDVVYIKSRSDEDLRQLRVMPPEIGESRNKLGKPISRNKMIASTSVPDFKTSLKQFPKTKSAKTVNTKAKKAFQIIPDNPNDFNSLFELDQVTKPWSSNPFHSSNTQVSLPTISINCTNGPANLMNSAKPRQEDKFLKVPRMSSKLRDIPLNSGAFGCGVLDFDDDQLQQQPSFKVFDRTLHGKIEQFFAEGSPEERILDEINLRDFWNFVEKWQQLNKDNRRSKMIFLNGVLPTQDEIDYISNKNKSKVNSQPILRRSLASSAVRMSVEQLPVVTTLLRASREGNEILIKASLRDIIINGISKEDLNSVDKSGRTAISYICSTNLTQFLDIFLQLANIDVNRADNEGNSPLHFAAEAGRSEIVNMLITRCRSLVIDPKNNLGFTPLMKAALNGRTRCAKLLLFAGASPVETDPKRQFRAEQWARFCGQYTCAEMIEKCARARLLEKTTSCKWAHDSLAMDKKIVSRSNTGSLTNTTTNSSGGIRSKLRKVFPFGFALKDKTTILKNGANLKDQKRSETTDLVSYLSAAALCASGAPTLPKDQTKFIKSLINPHDVPKLEVTYANNNTLIKKFEGSLYTDPGSKQNSPSVKIK